MIGSIVWFLNCIRELIQPSVGLKTTKKSFKLDVDKLNSDLSKIRSSYAKKKISRKFPVENKND